MSNVFKSISQNTKTIILVAWPLGCVLIGLSLILMWEDYHTSYAGYLALPTAKAGGVMVAMAVAALPQVGQIVLAYIFGRDTRRGWAILLAALFFLVDLGTDAWFKSMGDWWLMPLAIIESLFIFTLGSEILFTIAVGFVAEAFGEFIVATGIVTGSASGGLRGFVEALGLGNDHERH